MLCHRLRVLRVIFRSQFSHDVATLMVIRGKNCCQKGHAELRCQTRDLNLKQTRAVLEAGRPSKRDLLMQSGSLPSLLKRIRARTGIVGTKIIKAF